MTRFRLFERAVAIALLIGFTLASFTFLSSLATGIGAELAGSPPASAKPCARDSCDFVAFYAAGRLALEGHPEAAYSPHALIDAEHRLIGSKVAALTWYYPPPTLLPVTAIAALPFVPAFLVWSVVLIGIGILLLRLAGIAWPVVFAALLNPATLLSIKLGQFGWPFGTVFVAAMLMSGTHRRLAGALFGSLSLKPQSGLLGPILLLARRDWLALLSGAVLVFVLLLATTIVYGTGIWPAYFGNGLRVTHAIVNAPNSAFVSLKGISVFWMFRALGVGVALAGSIQTIVTALAAWLCYAVWREQKTDPAARALLTVCLSLLASPYAYPDGMCGYAVALALLIARTRRFGIAEVLLWIAPVLCVVIGLKFHMIIGPFVLIAGCLYAWRDLRIREFGTNPAACYPAAR